MKSTGKYRLFGRTYKTKGVKVAGTLVTFTVLGLKGVGKRTLTLRAAKAAGVVA